MQPVTEPSAWWHLSSLLVAPSADMQRDFTYACSVVSVAPVYLFSKSKLLACQLPNAMLGAAAGHLATNALTC
jgi:hypothetical protein